MAASLNRVSVIGNVGKAPEIRSLNNGDRVASFSVAVSEKWTSKDGEKKERTEWVPVVVFNDGLVGVIEKYVDKGSKLYVEGAFQTRKWEKDGVERYSTEVVLSKFNGSLVLLSGKEGSADTGREVARRAADLDDEIPF